MNNNQPLISVILPVYNAENTVLDSVNSILKQSVADFELIIINDGSTDKSLDIIHSIVDSRIKIVNQENKGLIYSLNHGIKIAKGKYLARMDADDISVSSRFENQINFLNTNEDYVLCSSSRYIFIEKIGDSNRIEKVPQTDSLIRIFSIFNSPFTHPAAMFRRDVVVENNIKFDENYKYAEDYKFWIDLLQHGKGYNFAEPLIYYKININGQTSIGNNNKIDRKIKILAIQEYALQSLNISISTLNRDILYDFSLTDNLKNIDISKVQLDKYVSFLNYIYIELSKSKLKNDSRVILGRMYMKLVVYNLTKVKTFKNLKNFFSLKFIYFSILSLIKF